VTLRLKRYAGIAAIVLLASLIAALLVAWVFQRSVTEPIVHLAEISRIVSRDKNYSMRATPTGNHDEPDLLIGSFNEMLGQIQEREGRYAKSTTSWRSEFRRGLRNSPPRIKHWSYRTAK